MSGVSLPRVLFGGVSSGSGKTTVACGVIQALRNRGMRLSAFKCGPDFIDPMFHARVLGSPSHNLDLFFTEEETVRGLLLRHSAGAQLAVLEGVMGYYDGVGGTTPKAGSYDLSRATETPAVLVVPARGASLSLAAVVGGFARFRPDSGIRGAVLNRCPPALYPRLKECVERETGVRVLGYLPDLPQAHLESRHLGLVTAAEIPNLQKKLLAVAEQCEKTIDLGGILGIARSAPPVSAPPLYAPARAPGEPLIAVAKDEAFCFFYEDNEDLLRRMGARLAPFSPLRDPSLPAGACGLILPGGYPELSARRLSENAAMLESIRNAVRGGIPLIAECGGFLYLHEFLEDADGTPHPAVGLVPGRAKRAGRMGNFGYVTLRAERDNLLCPAGGRIRAHEFHYWQSENPGAGFRAEKPCGGKSWPCVHAGKTVYAGFPHLYFYANPAFAERFVRACAAYTKERGLPPC
jgi:cobyrinic acid a,c-diamide synthase